MIKKLLNIQYILPVVFIVCSVPIFNKVYSTSRLVIDEEFHLRQGKHYCIGNFHVWDPKITTFPGLYLASCVLLPFKLCTIYNLRLVSLVAAAVNVFLIYKIRETKIRDKNTLILDAITIAILPPMYFFAHLYYTDVLSVTTILGMYYFWIKKSYSLSALCGAGSVLMRQTNILWVGFFLAISSIDRIVLNTHHFVKKKKRRVLRENYSFEDLLDTAIYNLKNFRFLMEHVKSVYETFWGYIIIILMFIAFLISNGSIVVGDKSAHEAAIHIPQFFYFSVFSAIFGCSLSLVNLIPSIKSLISNWTNLAISCAMFLAAVHYNTLVHPYLLADNRHYTFYIWNWFFGRYSFAKYLAVPVYMICGSIMSRNLRYLSSGFRIMFYVCCFFALALQKLLEVRYFIIPFLLLRLNAPELRARYVIVELLAHLIVNVVTFYLFFTKEIRWSNYKHAQRIIW